MQTEEDNVWSKLTALAIMYATRSLVLYIGSSIYMTHTRFTYWGNGIILATVFKQLWPRYVAAGVVTHRCALILATRVLHPSDKPGSIQDEHWVLILLTYMLVQAVHQ
jgi:hypothetical protein